MGCLSIWKLWSAEAISIGIPTALEPSNYQAQMEACRAFLYWGYVAAGHPIEAVSNPETLQIPESFLPGRNLNFVLRVKGESMIDAHIQDGDYVVVESRETARTGDMVVALIDGENVTLKKYYPEGSRVRLQPANEALEPIFVDSERIKIQGVVVSVMRKYQ